MTGTVGTAPQCCSCTTYEVMAVAVGEGVGLPADPGEDRCRCYADETLV